ncbi:hypothetical protein HY635_03615 [Candidatus Uhrbacteria bacterium]|nr:hypothetical protein [Candidatus Uhrbacteria bacterium]
MPPDPQLGGQNQVSERQLSWGLWFVAHRESLKKVGYGLLIAVAVVSWGYTLWGLTDHFLLRGLDLQRAIQRDLATRQNPRAAIIQRQRPKPLEIAEVYLIPNGGSSFDAAARIVNPNPRWLATIEYQLEVPGAPLDPMRTVLLPGRDRWLVRLNAESKANPSTAVLKLNRTDWHRLSHLDVADPKRFMDERLNVEVMSAAFVPPRELTFGTSPVAAPAGIPPTTVSRATFTAANRSAYGLRDLELSVLLRRSGGIIAVNRIVLNDLRAGEARAAAATWFHSLGLVQSVEVIPYVNAFDLKVFIEL